MRALALVLLVAGCFDGTLVGGHVPPGHLAIYGGVRDETTTSVVALFDGAYLCSGIVISPTVILSAAHCAWNLNGPWALTAQRIDDSPWLEVAASEPHPDWRGDDLGAGHDVALFYLAAPTSIPPMPLWRHPLGLDLAGHHVRLVGYGLQQDDRLGERMSVATQVWEVWETQFTVGDSMFTSCKGDSGGPALHATADGEVVIGITSWGVVVEGRCIGGAYTGRIDVDLAWIEERVAAAEGGGVTPQPPPPDPELSPEGICWWELCGDCSERVVCDDGAGNLSFADCESRPEWCAAGSRCDGIGCV